MRNIIILHLFPYLPREFTSPKVVFVYLLQGQVRHKTRPGVIRCFYGERDPNCREFSITVIATKFPASSFIVTCPLRKSSLSRLLIVKNFIQTRRKNGRFHLKELNYNGLLGQPLPVDRKWWQEEKCCFCTGRFVIVVRKRKLIPIF